MIKETSHPLYKNIDRHKRWARIGCKIIWVVLPIDIVCLILLMAMYYKEPAPSHSIITLPGEVIVINPKSNKV